uniref:CCHC-type domain-containing protein n=1 Tax=Ananas comosus var. bracteatus TaxID=296719 RepID=A0A6V7QP09_ANACO|nr:unnamed protein product [Ananas comosus var. bracteatus]
MVSKRQKLARKRFKEAHPNLFPKPEPSKDPSSSDPTKKTKKKKLKKSSGGTLKGKPTKRSGSALRKHPLRVPGMRPGESCFICKSKDHIAKLCPEKAQWENNKICLLCRQRGHSLKNCPEKSDTAGKKYCYNCGEVGHSLSKCPKPAEDGGTKFASCFICKERGHLSKNCPKMNMEYTQRYSTFFFFFFFFVFSFRKKGGCCKICGGVTHLARLCPNRGNKDLASSAGPQNTGNTPENSRQGLQSVYRSGDDLEDDFIAEEAKNDKKDADLYSKSESDAGSGAGKMKTNAKPKIKKGPKVVNFFG